MDGPLSVLGVESPVSLQSTDSRVSKHTQRPPSRSHDRPSYRLFPSVEPTPPASPVRKRSTRPTDNRIRSSSAHDSVRRPVERQDLPVKHVVVQRGRKPSNAEVKQMSTVQELFMDSPTVPTKYTTPPFITEDTIHSRSSSAPGERDATHSRKPSGSKLRPTWTSRHAETHPQAVKGLGLTLGPSELAPRQPRRQGPAKPKPNLRINVDHEDRPPPPPPKSPRHSRDPSAASVQSAVSSMHGESPDSATVVTPSSIAPAAFLEPKNDPIPTPLPLKAEQASYVQTSGQVRVREVAIPKDRSKQPDAPPSQLPDQIMDKPVITKIPAPDVDKPMPSLPTPSKRLSVHLREVREAESVQVESEKDTAPRNDAQSSAPTDTEPPSKLSLDPSIQKTNDHDVQPASQALKGPSKALSRDFRSPTPELGSRPQSPANLLQTVNTSAKVLPVLPTEGPPRSRSATPDTVATFLRPAEPKPEKLDPDQELQDINKQCEALHTRYASLRAERVKISTAISASLKDEKPGPDYANALLDQHLSLNAINSSMDICFAKLKSLDCRKEDAMATLLRQAKTKSLAEDPRKSGSTKSFLAPPFQPDSGRSTPEIVAEPKSLTPELVPTSKFSNNAPRIPEPKEHATKPESNENTEDLAPEKRVTIIRAATQSGSTADSTEMPPASPISSIHDMYATKRIRIKGAKAAKILGLVAQSANGSPDGKSITLPDNSPGMPGSFKKPIAVEVEIQSKSQERKGTSNQSPTPGTGPRMPKRKPPPVPRHDTKDSVSSSVASSTTESSPEEHEVTTPTGSEDAPFGLKSAKRGMLQTIQVFVDDDILDYYKGVVH